MITHYDMVFYCGTPLDIWITIIHSSVENLVSKYIDGLVQHCSNSIANTLE